jgi:L,D-peptidoglycan transpeptidase YkuD (ErfK/YbiS/YcfS/YnhG family)
MVFQSLTTWLVLAASFLSGCHARPPAEPVATEMPTAERADPRTGRDTGPMGGKTQLVTVVTEGWDRFRATLQRYERSAHKKWEPVGPTIDAVIGREGYAWGRGLHGDGAPTGATGPVKREGDGRSPAGVFGIGSAYGYEADRPDLSLPYVQALEDLRCVDDPGSAHYNQIVSTSETSVDWHSAEHMLREDELYALAIVVEHNTETTRPSAGSCIFLHLWKGPDVGMSGCTAISMSALDELAVWLKPDAAVLVALPRTEYTSFATRWGLP